MNLSKVQNIKHTKKLPKIIGGFNPLKTLVSRWQYDGILLALLL